MGTLDSILKLPEGPARVAAVAAWVQGLSAASEVPVLVGGAAVELYTGGAYRTGDLDFAGSLSREAEAELDRAGFRREGRHWIHEEGQLFLEFPSAGLAPGETTARLEVGGSSVVAIGLEELIVDRLAAWQFWRSSVDGVNAYLLYRTRRSDLDRSRLASLAEKATVTPALTALEELVARHGKNEPTSDELREWAGREPGDAP